MKKYILDTNVLLDDDLSIERLLAEGETEIYIPETVIEELDGLKKDNKLCYRVSKVATQLDIYKDSITIIKNGLKHESNDNKILKEISSSSDDLAGAEFITGDKLLRFKAGKLGLNPQPYKYSGLTLSEAQSYTGFINRDNGEDLEVNCFYWKDGKLHFNNRYGEEVPVDYENSPWKIKPRTPYQNAALDLMLNEEIDIMTVQSAAGHGKTYLALASALKLMCEDKRYKKIYVCKSNVEIGQKMGFLPGPQPLYAKILTPNGWSTMGDIKIGDYVIGADGKKVKVLNTFDKGIQDVYKIKTSKGGEAFASGNHPWVTKTASELKHNKEFKLRSTLEIKNTLLNPNKGTKFNHNLPSNSCVEFESVYDLPISPYTIGAMLGDGNFGKDNNTPCFINTDDNIIKRIEDEIKSLGIKLKKYNPDKIFYDFINSDKNFNNKPSKQVLTKNLLTNEEKIYNSIYFAGKDLNINKSTIARRCRRNSTIDNIKFSFIDTKSRWVNKAKNIFYELGLLGKTHIDKFIPNCYKYSTIENRLSLIQGLMDTDGTIKKNGEMSYTTTGKQLSLDIIEVLKSLGIHATYYIRDRVGKYSIYNGRKIISNHISYEICIPKSKFKMFYTKRKLSLQDFSIKKKYHEKIIDIKFIGKDPVKCIEIDNEDHLYITDDFIVTHNTIDEKIQPYFRPIFDLLVKLHDIRPARKIWKNDNVEKGETMEINPKFIEFLPINFVRGMNIDNAIILCDEFQNLTRLETRTILSRMGENCKCILLGDVNQIDDPNLTKDNNGLNWVLKKFRGEHNYGHVVLSGKKSRGPIADLVNKSGL